MKKSVLLSLFAASTLSLSATAAELPPALDYMIESGAANLVESFETDKEGLDGYVIKQPDGNHVIVYGMGKHSMAGVLLDEEGRNLTNRYADLYIPKPDHSDVAEDLKETNRVVTEGSADAPEMYVFADPNCGYCKRFYSQTRDLVANGELRINWVMVGFLHPSSEGIAAAVIEGGVDALEQANTQGRNQAPKLTDIPADLSSKITANGADMSAVGITGTPGLLYKTDAGWQTKSGVPSPSALGNLIADIER